MDENGFYVEDMGSKFGTLVLIKDEMKVEEDSKFVIQSGRLLMEVKRINFLKDYQKTYSFDLLKKEVEDLDLDI